MGIYKVRGRTVFFTKERAAAFRPIFRWLVEAAPHAKDRKLAKAILSKLKFKEEVSQLIFTAQEFDLFSYVVSEFPEGSPEGRQSKMDLFPYEPPKEILRRPKPLPELKTELTPEEQAERDSFIVTLGYQPKPDSYFEDGMRLKQEED